MKKTIKDFSLDFKTVILRCDLNVTIKDNKIVDDTRIKESLETIKYILDNNAKVVILSHLGKIKTEEDKEKNNLKIVCDRLNYYLDNKITFVEYDYDVKKNRCSTIIYNKSNKKPIDSACKLLFLFYNCLLFISFSIYSYISITLFIISSIDVL